MIKVKLKGGLGNQMFQYAFARAVSDRKGVDYCLDLNFLLKRENNMTYQARDYYLDIFNTELKLCNTGYIANASSFVGKISERIPIHLWKYISELQFNYDSRVFKSSNNAYFTGYWQSPKYFSDIESQLRKEFCFSKSLQGEALNTLGKIESMESVCLNVRRSDYVGNKLHDVCDVAYYNKAIKTMMDLVETPVFFIFSDDIDWCKENLKLESQHFFVTHDVAHSDNKRNFDYYLQLMTNCKNFIIPNSTFAWWAVWLNKSDNCRVIAPSKWFTDDSINTEDLYSSEWTLI